MPRAAIAVPSMARLGIAVASMAFALAGAPAWAQGAGCVDIQKTLLERKSLVERIGVMNKRKATPQEACAAFTKLVSNGATVVKWMEANKDWCQVPDAFAEGMKGDHGKAISLRTKVCGIAAQQATLQKKAQQAQQSGQGGLLGGGGLTGSYRMPQGAL